MRIRTAAIATALSLAFSATAGAFAPGDKGESPLETAASQPPRTHRTIIRTTPQHARAALDRIAAAGLANVRWDRDTDVAAQLWGAGIAAPGSIANPAKAETAARSFLADHLGVLAPGSATTDFTLGASSRRDDRRIVVLQQNRDGMRVLGASISFVFKHDRLIVVSSSALPDVTATAIPVSSFHASSVRGGAQQWIASVTGRTATASDLGTPSVLPIVHRVTSRGPEIEYHVVQPVKVSLTDTEGAWEVYVNANAQPIARKNLHRYAQGTVVYNVPERYPGGVRSLFAAALATHTVNGSPVTSNALGVVTWTGAAPSTVTPGLVGPKVRMHNNGALATTSLTLAGGGTATWDEGATGSRDAQLTSFIHANLVKEWVKANVTDTIPWVDQQLDVYVNESGNCNAYSTGDDIHFFPADSNCENTGRLADVVYHEFGHSLQAHASNSGNYDGDLGEGQADFLAAMITNDHGMGRGFFFSSAPLRDLDPSEDKVYPDDLVGQVHADGEIIGQTLWDMRKGLIASLGEPAAAALAARIYLEVIETSDTIPGCYTAALTADDDDGNLANGTPNECVIQEAFAAHGLADAETLGAGAGLPVAEGLTITVPVTPPTSAGNCAVPEVLSGTLRWNVRGEGNPETLTLVETDLGGGNSAWSATIPAQADATVVNYRLSLTLSNGNVLSYPDNAADPDYEMYIGQVEEIWCDDFEAGLGEWTHGADAGTDEWVVGVPSGLADDPTAAFDGTNVLGVDLAANGAYRRDSNQWVLSPAIDVTGKEGVRLQYQRWLGVEDGFFDKATITADGVEKWSNLNSNQGNSSDVTHKDKEWRFHDVDLGDEAADGTVQVEFRLESDPGLEFGGWTMDRVCIVGRLPGGVCGDGITAGVEQCDDMNTADGDGCSATCQDETGGDDEPGAGGCCSTGSGPGGPILLGLMTVGALIRRRRRA